MHGRWLWAGEAARAAAQRLKSAAEPHRAELLRSPPRPSVKRLHWPQCQAQQASLRCVHTFPKEANLLSAKLCELAQLICN